MDSFRLILLAIGAVIILAIYLWDRWRRHRSGHEEIIDAPLTDDELAAGGDDDWEVIPLLRHAVRGVPVDDAHLREFAGFSGRDEAATVDEALESMPTLPSVDAMDEEEQPVPAEQLLVLTVVAPEGESYTGATLSELFEHLDLRYGDMRIFHRIDADSGESVFSVVSIIEPGYFDLENMHELRTPGLALFMRLPGPLAGSAAFEDLYATAQALAVAREGRIGDQARNLLTDTTLAHMRAQAARYRAA